MDTRTALALVLGGLAVYLAHHNPALGAALGIGVVVATLLLTLLEK
ncbi:membrane protein [Streptomyces noursei ATCC 11455]|nr:membrane protein [Streptomyces noursei ATCC 11455]